MYLYLTCLGDYREGETPGPIPNPEAKPLIADNTADFICGNVGRCLVCLSSFYLINLTFVIKYLFDSLYIIHIEIYNNSSFISQSQDTISILTFSSLIRK